jgi:caffeoyl-CoA O-methyltransferase
MTVYNDRLSRYITEHFAIEDDALTFTQEDTRKKGLPTINIKPEEGRFLQMLVRACGAKKAVEVGTLGGYSGIWIARGLAPGGKLITLEKEPLHARVAQEHFIYAGLDSQIEIRVGNAHQLLHIIKSEGPFDFVFIDADKLGYISYLDWALKNTRLGGVIAAHNSFRGGSVIDAPQRNELAEFMHQFNKRMASDSSLISTIYPAGDGIIIGVKNR